MRETQDCKRAQALVVEGRALQYPSQGAPPDACAVPRVRDETLRIAMSKYAEAARLCPTLVEAHLELAHAARRLGDPRTARAHADRALNLRPSEPMIYQRIAHHFKGEEARRVLRTGLRRCKPKGWQRSLLVWSISVTYWYEGRFDQCVAVLQRLRRAELRAHGSRSPKLRRTLFSLAEAYAASGDHVRAENVYRALLQLKGPRNEAGLNPGEEIILGRIRSDDPSGAREALIEFRKDLESHSRMLLECTIRVLLGEPPRCPARLLKIIEEDDSPYRTAFYGALVLHALGRDDLALPRFRKLAERWQGNPREWGITLRWEIAYAKQALGPK